MPGNGFARRLSVFASFKKESSYGHDMCVSVRVCVCAYIRTQVAYFTIRLKIK